VGIFAGLLVRMGQPDRGKEPVKNLGQGRPLLRPAGWVDFHPCCGEIDLAADWFEKVIEEQYPMDAQISQTPNRRAAARKPALAKIGGDDESAHGFSPCSSETIGTVMQGLKPTRCCVLRHG
jgi:hypothetical protein